ncbi:MAG: hypothetical protein MJZ63_08610 [Muribaculaceae bacterium]|nr:hypothetical protein [Muribaculaceae bacterium]
MNTEVTFLEWLKMHFVSNGIIYHNATVAAEDFELLEAAHANIVSKYFSNMKYKNGNEVEISLSLIGIRALEKHV